MLFVPALIFMLHHAHVLYPMDNWAFLVIGNFGSIANLVGDSSYRTERGVAVALIDTETHEQRYAQRSPLDRCELLDDIGRLYDAHPHLIAIDLDISPAPWLRGRNPPPSPTKASARAKADKSGATDESTKRERGCETQLYALIKGKAAAGTRTVLVTPAKPSDAHRLKALCDWQASMHAAGVRFGRTELPQEIGMVVRQYYDRTSFAAAVEEAGSAKAPSGSRECQTSSEREEWNADLKLINPLLYGSAIWPVPLKWPEGPSDAHDRQAQNLSERITQQPAMHVDPRAPFQDRLSAALGRIHPRVVFYGAAYGDDFVFQTPVGPLYGVEIQAAAYLSRIHPITEREWMGLLGDVAIAFLFSIFIAIFWKRYFRGRMSSVARDRQFAAWYVIALGIVFVGLVFLACVFSVWAFGRLGVWLSPVPIAIGMLLDAFMLGSVNEAIHASDARVAGVVARLRQAPRERFEDAAEEELRQHRPHANSLAHSVHRFFIADWLRLVRSERFAAGGTILMRRAIWTAVVAAAVFSAARSILAPT